MQCRVDGIGKEEAGRTATCLLVYGSDNQGIDYVQTCACVRINKQVEHCVKTKPCEVELCSRNLLELLELELREALLQ